MNAVNYYFTFSGRINVKYYWLTGIIPNLILIAVGLVIDVKVFGDPDIPPATCIIQSFWFLPALSIMFRRCHDLNRSANYLWYLLIPFVDIFVALKLAFSDGTTDKNRYDRIAPDDSNANPIISPLFLMFVFFGIAISFIYTHAMHGKYPHQDIIELLPVLLPLFIMLASVFAASFIEIYSCTLLLTLLFMLVIGIIDGDIIYVLCGSDHPLVFPIVSIITALSFCINYATRSLRRKFYFDKRRKGTIRLNRIESLVGCVLLIAILAFYVAVRPPTLGTVRRTNDPSKLVRIALESRNEDVCTAATNKLYDQVKLAEIVKSRTFVSARYIALEKLTDQMILVDVALYGHPEKLQQSAIDRITHLQLLNKVAREAKDKEVKNAAYKRIRYLEETSPSEIQ